MKISNPTYEISSFVMSINILENCKCETCPLGLHLHEGKRKMKDYNRNPGYGPLFSGVVAMVSPAHEVITRRSLYDQVPPLTLNPKAWPFARRILGAILQWHQQATERRALRQLDDRLLQDIGIERSQALMEAEKPFWRD
jgi:uncharacterized protein YjiS (DUF1127 family)